MKNYSPYLLQAFFIAACITTISGCEKVYDYIHFPGKGDSEYKACDIKEIDIASKYNNDTIRYFFSYNNQGNPVSILNTGVVTSNPNCLFKYDKSHRLVQFIRTYTNGYEYGSYESWNKFGYNQKNQIVDDTMYTFGTMTPDGPLPYAWLISIYHYSYDAQGRLAGEYDSRGDLVRPGIVYDNKANIFRTNKVWMFIGKNYSVNNPFTADSYNSFALPTVFATSYGVLGYLAPVEGIAHVQYNCR